jgi:hypothetical protein
MVERGIVPVELLEALAAEAPPPPPKPNGRAAHSNGDGGFVWDVPDLLRRKVGEYTSEPWPAVPGATRYFFG